MKGGRADFKGECIDFDATALNEGNVLIVTNQC